MQELQRSGRSKTLFSVKSIICLCSLNEACWNTGVLVLRERDVRVWELGTIAHPTYDKSINIIDINP